MKINKIFKNLKNFCSMCKTIRILDDKISIIFFNESSYLPIMTVTLLYSDYSN